MEEKSTADRISELPDEILHCILSRIKPQRVAAQTITLSRRWRSLWHLYPVVAFNRDEDERMIGAFQKFGEATIERFSRDRLLRMETLNIHVWYEFPGLSQLLDLSSERKAEEINIFAWSQSFPFRLLSNSATKILRLTGVQFYYNKHCDGFPLSLNSLRVLQLTNVFFDEDQLFQNLIASSPLLETLEIEILYRRMRKLKVSTHHTNLKSLRIARCFPREIEITAPGLQTLRLEDLQFLSKFELTAPQLNLLEITHYSPRLKHRCFDLVLPNLRSLKSLTLNDPELQKKLKLSNPN